MGETSSGRSWDALWQCLAVLQDGARKLRHLSQQEPLLQSRPDFPRARTGRSHAEELREVLDGLLRQMEDARRLIPEVFADGISAGGLAADEAPQAMAERLAALLRMTVTVKNDAFQPPPPLPKHAPPYLAGAPPPLAGSRALLLSAGLDEVVAGLRNALLAVANTAHPEPPHG